MDCPRRSTRSGRPTATPTTALMSTASATRSYTILGSAISSRHGSSKELAAVNQRTPRWPLETQAAADGKEENEMTGAIPRGLPQGGEPQVSEAEASLLMATVALALVGRECRSVLLVGEST